LTAFHCEKQLDCYRRDPPISVQHMLVGCCRETAGFYQCLKNGAPGMKAMGTQIVGKFLFYLKFEAGSDCAFRW